MTEQEQPVEPEYWNVDEAIGNVTLWRDQRYTVRLKAHIADELYRQPRRDEIIPLQHQQGVRTYVHAKPYVLVPDITLDVQVFPTPDPGGAIGEVSSSTWEGMRHEELGNCQAWLYIEDRSIVLWEAYMLDRYRTPNLADDTNTLALWEGFERFLTQRFPSARLIATTYDDPEYDTKQYQEFLERLGYRRLSTVAFGKDLEPLGAVRLRITLAQDHAEVTALVALAAAELDTADLSVWVKNCSWAFAGRAYFEARHCVVRIGKPSCFPIRTHHYPGLKTAPMYDLNTWQEALVLVTAHELRHQAQHRLGQPKSEVDAERWAVARLQAYRDADIAQHGLRMDRKVCMVLSQRVGPWLTV